MFKFVGCILILISSFFIFNRNTFENYFTYKFLKKITEIIIKLEYERNTNRIYEELFKYLHFDWQEYILISAKNRYVREEEINRAKNFFNNLGKRDNLSEEKYIHHYYEYFFSKQKLYGNLFKENQKLYGICGISFGFFAIIFLI